MRSHSVHLLRLCLLIAALLSLGLIFFLDMLQPKLANGGYFPDHIKKSFVLSSPAVDREGGSFSYTLFQRGTEREALELLAVYTLPFLLSVNGREVYRAEPASAEQRILVIPLEDILEQFGAGEPLVFRLRPVDTGLDALLSRHTLYLSPQGTGSRFENTLDFIRISQIGFFFALALFGATLFLHKRDQAYILCYALLAMLLCSIAICLYSAGPASSSSGSVGFFRCAKRFLGVVITGLESLVFFQLSSIGDYPLGKLLQPVPLMAIALLNALVIFFQSVPISTASLIICRLLFLFYAAYAAYRVEPGRFPLSLIFVITQCLWAEQTLVDHYFNCSNLYFRVFLSPPITDLPFTIYCMLLTNRRFAGKFREAEALNTLLDQKVEQRTRELTEVQRRKHQLMVNVFHDLRSPIFVTEGCFKMLKEENPQNTHVLSIMKAQSDFIGELTEDLFFLAKLEDGKVLFREDNVDLGALLKDMEEAFSVLCGKKSLRLHFSPRAACIVEGDAMRLQRALQNLLINSIEHAEAGSVIRITMDADSESALISFTNFGNAIPAEDLSRIFHPYYSKNSAARSGSSGLGLSIADEIIRHHGGSIGVKSSAREGTTFTVSLPLLCPEP